MEQISTLMNTKPAFSLQKTAQKFLYKQVIAVGRFFFVSGLFAKNSLSKRLVFKSSWKFKLMSLLAMVMFVVSGVKGQTAYSMSSGNKTWDFTGTWVVSSGTYSGTDAGNWASVGIIGTGSSVTTGLRTSKTSATITSGMSGGFQKPSGTVQFLSSGSTSTPESVAIDLLLDFTGRTAGTLSFDWAAIDNASGTRPTSLRIFWSTNGTTFTEIAGAQLLDKESATSPSSGTVSTIALPSNFNDLSTARLRFYNHAGTTATGSGNRDKFQIDNIAITSTASTASSSNIILKSTFTHATNIDYTAYQAASGLISSNSIEVGQFDIQDGGGSADADALATTLTACSLTVANSSNIRALALFDGSTNVGEVTTVGSTAAFSSLTLAAADGGNKTFSIRATFKSAVTDNQQISFTVASATASSSGSGFAAANAGAAATSTTGDNNRIEVATTDIIFDQNVSTVSQNSVMNPSPTARAVDVNANYDLDNTSNVVMTISTGSTTYGAATTTVAMAAGVATFSNLIFTTAATANNLTATQGSYTDISSVFNVAASAPEIHVNQGATSLVSGSGTYAAVNSVSGNSGSPVTFTIENIGSANLTYSSITNSNSTDFTLNTSSTTSPISASGTTTFTIAFNPTTAGAKSTTITIYNNDADEGIYTFTVTGTGTVSAASDIINTSVYSYTSNVGYSTFQTPTTLTPANSVGVNGLTIRDGGATADTDNLGTTLSALTISTGGSTAIRTASLFDGTTNIVEVAVNGATSIVFTGLSLSTSDGGTKDFELRVTYQSTVTDNQQITFTVSAATASSTASGFTSSTAGAAASSATSDINRIEVNISQLVFSQQPSVVNSNVSMSPSVTVTAKDANSNIDLDFTDNVRVSSTGTMTSSPVSVAAVSGVATFSTLTHTASGSGLTLLAERNNSGAWDLDLSSNTFMVTVVSATTDYFRSAATGTWVTAASWESSADGINNWITATLTPTSTANIITIRNGHTITISAIVSIDQVTVQSGGILTLASGGVATIVNGTSDDIIIQNGGRINYQLAPTYSSSTIRINGGGILSIEVSGVTGAAAGVNASTHIYDDASILQWNISTATPSSSNVTFFPNVINEIPILRFASATNGNWGASSSTAVNGKVEIASGVSITLNNTGTKTFKYGLTGAGMLNQGSAGQIIFSGTTSEIGGTATLNLSANGGLSVSGNLTVTGTLVCGAYLVSGAGAFTLSSGATLKTANATGVAGSIIVSGTKTFSSAANYEFNGAATGTFTTYPTANTVNDLTINRSAGVALGQNVTVNGILNLTSGIVSTSTNILTIAAAAAVSNASANSFINGNLRRHPPTGTVTAFLLPIGDAVNYSPVTIDFAGSVSGTGYLDAVVSIPNIAPEVASGISQTKYVNRKWTLTNFGITGFTSYAPTFTFVSGDIQGAADPTAFVIRNFASTWNTTTIGNANATTTSATGQTTFTDFVLGEKTELSVSTQPSSITICHGSAITFTAGSSSSPTPTVQWQRDAGTGFVNITANLDAATTYSGFNTNTLTLAAPVVSLNGYQYKAVYTNINGSVTSNAVTATVNPRPTAVITGTQAICAGTTSSAISVALTGTQPWNLTYTDGITPETVSSISSSPYTFTVSPTSTKTYTLTALSDVNCTAQAGDLTGSAVVTVNSIPAVPTGTAVQNFCLSTSPAVANLSAAGTAIIWYDAATSGSIVMSGTALVNDAHYYATQTVSSCESSSRLDVTAGLNANGTWIGGTSGVWNLAANWCGGVPTSGANILFSPSALNDLLLDQDRSVGNVDFNGSSKSMLLGAFHLTTTGISNTSANSYIKTTGSGKLSATILNGATFIFPVGNTSYNALSIKNTTGTTDVFSVGVQDVVYLNGVSGTTIATAHVKRTWDIFKANANAGTGVDLQFNWNTGDVYGYMVDPRMNHHTGSAWEIPTVASSTLGSNALTVVGYTGTFSPFAVGEGSSPLPVELLSFHANCIKQGVALTWQTASEHSSAYFDVERSEDNQNWNVLENVQAAGNSTSLLTYSALDTELARSAVYYRLKQVDFDGAYKLYDPISMQCGEQENEITTYPNPSSDEGFQLLFENSLGERNVGLSILDARGNSLYTKTLQLQTGVNVFNIYDFEAETGIYFLQILEVDKTTTQLRHMHNSLK